MNSDKRIIVRDDDNDDAASYYIPYELECIICKKWTPLATMRFFPFMKGGVCDVCYKNKPANEIKTDSKRLQELFPSD